MRFDAISKYQHNFIKKDFMFDYKYLLNSLCKNNEGFDSFDYFVKSILRYFSLQAGFVIRIDNENININSKNLSKEKITVKPYTRTPRQPGVRQEMLAGLPQEVEEYVLPADE